MLDARNVTVIVVTYNRLPLLKQCLAALRAQTVQGFTVLLRWRCWMAAMGKQQLLPPLPF